MTAPSKEEYYVFPMSFAQQRLWFLDRLEEAAAAYHVPAAVRLRGELNAEILERGLNEILRRHEALRTTFGMVEGRPSQIIHPPAPVRFLRIDLSRMPRERRESALEVSISKEVENPFELSRGPLFRTSLIRLGEEENVLLVVMHHIVSDGWSLGVFMRELCTLYNSYLHDAPTHLEELPIQYADYAVWQQEWLSGGNLERQTEYWREALADAPALLSLPTDRKRSVRQTFRGASISFEIGAELLEGLSRVADESQCTLPMILMAAFSVMLSRMSGQRDILVGTPVAGRTRSELEPLIGLFVNTIVLRSRLDGDRPFLEILRQVRETALGAYANQEVPFERIVEAVRPVRSLGHSPLFQVMFILQNLPRERFRLDGISETPVDIPSQASKFDLTVSLVEAGEGLSGVFEYNAGLFDEASIARLAGHFETLLGAIVENPDMPWRRLPLLSSGEREEIIALCKGAESPPLEWTVFRRFEDQARRNPQAEAIRFRGECVTYGDLSRRVNRLGVALREKGVGSGDSVGILLQRSPDMVAALLAAMKVGAAYVPMDPSFPLDRLAFMASDSGIEALLCHGASADRIPEGCRKVIRTELYQDPAGEAEPCELDDASAPSGLAYIIYTSGTTGRPKGVEITHGALSNFLESMAKIPGMDARDTLLAVTTVSFDIAGLELFLPLVLGGGVVLADRETAADGFALAKLLDASGATVMQGTPATWKSLLDAGWAGNPKLKILCGGEALPRSLAMALCKRGESVWNLYGPTETTIWSSMHCVQAREEAKDAESWEPIGRPIGNTSIYILDENLDPLPVGVSGEIYIGGAGLARGYHGRPRLTAERFLPDPFEAKGTSRIYATGDRGKCLRNGTIIFQGRVDHQVKIRGFRIELGEVESVLRELSFVKDCVVAVEKGGGLEGTLIAFCVPRLESGLKESEVRAMLRRKLPEYMLPRRIVPVPSIPLNSSGKVDRDLLLSESERYEERESRPMGPRDGIERKLLSIWEEVLRKHPVGVEDNFFEMGGHSLLAVRLVAAMGKAFDQMIPLADLFQKPTVRELAEVFRGGEAAKKILHVVPIRRTGSKRPFFAVPGAGGSPSYYAELAGLIDRERPFFGFRAPGLSGEGPPPVRIEEIGECYIGELRKHQAEGPYILGGHSFGSRVALWMVRRLVEAGERVACLVVFDTVAPVFERNPVGPGKGDIDWILEVAEVMGRYAGREMELSRVELEKLDAEKRLSLVGSRLEEAGVLPAAHSSSHLRWLLAVYKANHEIHYRPTPKAMPLPIHLFKAAEVIPSEEDAGCLSGVMDKVHWGWRPFSTVGVRVATVPGNHITMLARPNVEVLGGRLKEVLRACDE